MNASGTSAVLVLSVVDLIKDYSLNGLQCEKKKDTAIMAYAAGSTVTSTTHEIDPRASSVLGRETS